MTAVISCLQAASIGTSLGSVALRLAEGKVLVANVSVVAIAVEGSVDGAPELGWAVVASNSCWRRIFVVGWREVSQCQLNSPYGLHSACTRMKLNALRLTIRPSDDNLEGVSPLPVVGGFCGRYWCAPEGAFIICCAGRVGAGIGIGVNSWIALDIQVKCLATCCLIAFRLAAQRVIAFQSIKSHVVGGTERAIGVGEDKRVAIWGWHVLCKSLYRDVNLSKVSS